MSTMFWEQKTQTCTCSSMNSAVCWLKVRLTFASSLPHRNLLHPNSPHMNWSVCHFSREQAQVEMSPPVTRQFKKYIREVIHGLHN